MLKTAVIDADVLYSMKSAAFNKDALNAILKGSLPQEMQEEGSEAFSQWSDAWSDDIVGVSPKVPTDEKGIFLWAANHLVKKLKFLMKWREETPIQVTDIVPDHENHDWCDLYFFTTAYIAGTPRVLAVWADGQDDAVEKLERWVKQQEPDTEACLGELDIWMISPSYRLTTGF